MAWFYEIRTPQESVLKREGGFSSADAAKTAVRADAKRLKACWQPGEPQVGQLLIGQNMEKANRNTA